MVYIAQQSFGFGEVDPNVRAQYESTMYQKGCRTLENGMLSETGSARKRWGSVYSSTITNGDKAFEFIDGYGERYLVIGNSTGYTIEVGGTEIASFTSTGPPTDVSSTGSEFIVVLSDGLFLHKTVKNHAGTVYSVTRSKIDPTGDLVSTAPPVTFTSNAATPTTVTSSSKWFSSGEVGDLYKLCETSDRFNTVDTGPRWGIVSRVISPTSVDITTVDPVYLQQSGTAISGGLLTVPGHGFPDASFDSQRPTAKWYRGEVDSNFYTGEPTDATTVWVERVTDDTLELYSNPSGSNTLFNISNTSGQSRTTYLLKLGGDNVTANQNEGLPDFPDSVTTASSDWVGPYRHWTPLSNAVWTNFNYSGSGDTMPSGVHGNSGWSAWALKATLKWDSSGAGSWGTGTDNIHQQLVSQGVVLKAVHYKKSGVYATSYFVATWKPFMGNDGAINTASPRLTHICGPALVASGTQTTVQADVETLIWYIASSEDQTSTAIKTASGTPSPKNGWNPSLLVRTEDSNPDGASNGTTYPVAIVGSPARTGTYTSYQSSFSTNTYLTSTVTTANCINNYSVLAGEIAPIEGSTVFRIGKWEKEFYRNWPSGKTEAGEGPVGNWVLTGSAFSPPASTNPTFTNEQLVRSSISIYHQSRVALSGFSPVHFSTEDTGGLEVLVEAKFLGTTIMLSRPGTPSDFTTGALQNDGISFQISAKKGGQVKWMASHLNTLIVGTGEEEFVVADAPLTPTQINVSSQSEYGSKGGAAAEIFGSNIVFIQRDGKTIRSMGYQERRRRYESDDLMQFARHITKSEVITRIAVVGTATQYLFALTDAGKLWCLSHVPQNHVFGWSEWKNDNFTIEDILGTVDDNGNPSLFARTSTGYGIFFTSDPARGDLLVDMAVNAGSIAVNYCIPGSPYVVGDVLAAIADGVYVSTNPVHTVLGGILQFPDHPSAPAVVVVGYNYTMTLAPNIPELMIPGKGSTLGREKNVSRLRVLFNQARGGTAAGHPVLAVPADSPIAVVLDEPGFHSIPVVGEYGPQPTINITQSAPYGFEVSGYNAEYDFGD